MTTAITSSLPQRPCVNKRQRRYLATPKKRRRSITTLEPPPAPKKRSEIYRVYYDEMRYNLVFGGGDHHRNLFVPSLSLDATSEETPTATATSMDNNAEGSHHHSTVMLRPRFSSGVSSQLLQQRPLLASSVGALPLFPLLDDDDCIISDDDDVSEVSDLPFMPQVYSFDF